jgi:hypothetical protein
MDMDSSSGLFLRDGEDLIGLSEQAYEAEDVLQALLAKHPDLLPGEAMNPQDPRRFLLIKREAQIAGMQLDHLFIDQDGIPTFIETKRGTNTQVRREIVAQMLDYAANAAREWSAERFSDWLEERAAAEGRQGEELLAEFEPSVDNPGEFWAQVEQNLRDGKVRLLFAADEIPSSLQRIVEFLNERMTPTEVLAAEIRQYVSADGKQLLQARLVGQTEKARDIKGQTRLPPVLDVLISDGVLTEGQDLWLRREILRKGRGDHLDDNDRLLHFTLKINGGTPRVLYQPVENGEVEELAPSRARDRVRQELDPDFRQLRPRTVIDSFSIEPGGKTLGEIATERGLWG